MKILKYSTFLLTCILSVYTSAQDVTLVKVVEESEAPMISKHIYGHFSEHLGRCIYGGLYVGEESVVPNTAGVRNDIIDALKELQIPNLRWPGGCFADTYHWKDGVGPKDERPTMVNRWWGGVTEDNSFGTHDFLNLCETLGAEPYLAANVGSSTVKEFTEYVEYVLHEGGSPMAEWRKENGREEPWNVKYWGVGNEMWGCGGNMTAEHYADVYRQYATFMTDWTNSDGLFRIASGANVDDYHWTEVLMRDVPKHLIEGVALHSYSFVEWNEKGSSIDYSEEQYFSTMKTALKMDTLVTKHSAIMDKYDPDNTIALVVDEWGGWYEVMEGTNPGFLYQQNTMRDAMIAGTTLNIFNNHAERVKMANLAQTVNVLQAVVLTEGEKMLLTPTYHVMKMYNVHQDAKLLPVEFNSPTYKFEGEELPAISVSASKNESGTVHVSLVNIDAHKKHNINLSLEGLGVKRLSGIILTSDNLQDYNSFETPGAIQPKEFSTIKVKKGIAEVELPPFSVLVLKGE
ncbi:MAG: alpha-L-arabinofuranosidase C-terminal domain-containing protein [Bacteroidota bacterium]|uniref:non-reducing end alpha-L-arabinofuranosidase n=1 Tax=Flagellimonas profundi TaxID=2915620 RepID=A0ABS3FK33_9FLAO|nr:alpha-L-arabinofuranosidase C-terminal domain-containing protein [Allomuricauda profundi]MBO0343306.1 alpha-N-arabinofuranosidase [Allomuricauda profundi]MEC7772173.1 alpha-L-arabinofuranosidase C-terminal domain-containing protein [Bacteroidota bacterium]